MSRQNYFEQTGSNIQRAQNIQEALALANMDFEVDKQPMFLSNGTTVPNKFANVRIDTNEVLGCVGNNYNVLQNSQAFEFIDNLTMEGATFEKAGQIKNGAVSFVLAKTDEFKILDDTFDPYILITNSHDGSTPITAMFTPIRVVCANAVVAVTKKAENKITIRHGKSAVSRLEVAKDTLFHNTKYLQALKERSEQFAKQQFSVQQYQKLVETLVPVNELASNNSVENALQSRLQLMNAYNQYDLQNYNNTAYKAIQAVADYESHKEQQRNTGNNNYHMQKVIKGMLLLNTALKIVESQTLLSKARY